MTLGVSATPLVTWQPTSVNAASANRAGLPSGSSRVATRRALSVIERAVRTASRRRTGLRPSGLIETPAPTLHDPARDLGLVAPNGTTTVGTPAAAAL